MGQAIFNSKFSSFCYLENSLDLNQLFLRGDDQNRVWVDYKVGVHFLAAHAALFKILQ
jgi:hypothetical protein